MLLRHPLPSAALSLALVTALPAQGVNCRLLGTYNQNGPFNDVWGYVAPNGDEYALLGTTTSTIVIDVTVPTNPVQRGIFPFGNSGWRDIRTFGPYAYVVTESTAGFQILDLTNPNSPTVVGVFGTSVTTNAHNVCIDTGAARLYLVGTNVGAPVWDISNPISPVHLGNAHSTYLHDLCVENGYAYGSAISNGNLVIMDATTPLPYTVLSLAPSPGATHNAWPNAAGTICAVADESSGGVVSFFDVSNKANPVPLGRYTPNTASTPHNAFIIGDKCHVSWYTEGYRLLDISDPTDPIEIASYDTWPGASGGFSGAWGCYPFLPSGNVLISDRSTGLYVLDPGTAHFRSYGDGCPGSVPRPCPQLNPGGGSLTGATRTNEYCLRVENPAQVQVTGFDIFTNATLNAVTRPAHLYADIGGLPSPAALASTTMQVGVTPGFYTATFPAPVPVSGDFYIGVDGSTGNVVVPTLASGDNGVAFFRNAISPNWALSGLVQFPSYRVNCITSATATPEIGNSVRPVIGATYDVTLSDAVANSAAFFLTGLSATSFQGVSLPAPLPGAPGCNVLAAPHATRFVPTTGTGTASALTVIPNSPIFAGLTLYHQWAVLDGANPLGVVVSNAGRAVIDV